MPFFPPRTTYNAHLYIMQNSFILYSVAKPAGRIYYDKILRRLYGFQVCAT
uniref:Uncharacterized protein n=1 Tax=Anopheles dirus TaxID=7168 RepID=A0A182NWY0_9DIPT